MQLIKLGNNDIKRSVGARRRVRGRRLVGRRLVGRFPGQASYQDALDMPQQAYDRAVAEVIGEDPRTGSPVWEEPTNHGVGVGFIGFAALAVAAGASADVVIRPDSSLFRIDRLIISDALAPNFVVDEIKFGMNTIFVAEGQGVPSEFFSSDATDNGLGSYTLSTSQALSMTFTNISAAAADIRGGVKGRYLR